MAAARGSSMWGGRRPDDVGEPRTIHAVDNTTPEPDEAVSLRPLFSLTLVVLGAIMSSVGLGLILGIGGALAGTGLTAVTIGIILGMGEET